MSQRNKTKVKRKKYKFGKVLLIVLLMFLISTVVYGYTILKKVSKSDVEAKRVDISEPVNVLLLGVDAGDPDNKTDNNPKRSDTMMLFRYDPSVNKVSILSIPRDTKVTINRHTAKINSAHAIGGADLAIKTVEKLLGIDINYYAKVDYVGFKKCIDAVGGIDIIPDRDMNYDANDISIHFKKGEKVHLDGQKAEEYVRWRKNNDGDGYAMGDIGRISTQQDFMIRVFEKIKSPLGFIRIPSLINTISKYVETNVESKDIIKYMLKLKKINLANIDSKIIGGEPKYINGVSYFIYNRNKNMEITKTFKSNKKTGNVSSTDKNDINVKILNSTGVNGLASKYKNDIEKMGYKVVNIGNYGEKLKTTLIKDYSKDKYGEILCNDIGIGRIIEREGSNSPEDIVVILGEDSVK